VTPDAVAANEKLADMAMLPSSHSGFLTSLSRLRGGDPIPPVQPASRAASK
jgi:hypothetical protein